MGIKVNGKDLIGRYSRGKPVDRVYSGANLVWENNSYQILPYIVSKGTSWSDTGLYIDPTIHRVQGSFIVDDLSRPAIGNIYIMEGARNGASQSNTKVNTQLRKLSATTYELRRDWGTSQTSGVYDGVVYEVGKEYFFDYTPEYTEINGLRLPIVPYKNGDSRNTYWIGRMNDPALSGYYPPGMRATRRTFSVYETGEIIGESIPTYTKLDSSFNFYDKISDEYLENKGPESWTGAYESWVYDMGVPLSGIVTEGLSWFAPDFELGYTGKTEIKAITKNTSSTKGLYGWYDSTGKRISLGIASEKWFSGLDTTTYGSTAVLDEETTLIIDRDNEEFIVNGTVYRLARPSTIGPSYKPFLCHRSNTVGGTFSSPFIGTLCSWIEYDTEGNKLIDSIPFLNNNGVVGILDLISKKFQGSITDTPFSPIMTPVYAINWRDEGFDPIAGKVATIGSTGFTDGLFWDDWTDGQKQVFRGKKIKVSWKLSAKDVVQSTYDLVGFSTAIFYKDGTTTSNTTYSRFGNIFAGLESPYTLAEDFSLDAVIQIQDKEIDNVINRQPQFFLSNIASGEMKAYDIKWEVDVPEDEIYAIESMNIIGMNALADYEDNINELNKLGL